MSEPGAGDDVAEIRPPSQKSPSLAGSSVGGASAGTGLVAVAQSIGPSTTLGAILLYAAPAASVIIGTGLYFVELQVSRYFERRLARSAIKTLTKQLQNPATSNGHKARIRKFLEEVENSVAASELERVKGIGRLPVRAKRQYEQS